MTAPGLSKLHERSLAFSCLDLHQRLADIESQFSQADEHSAFSRIVPDLAPVERRVVRDYFGRIRSVMRHWLKSHDIRLDVDRISLRWSALTALLHVQVALADLRPERLRGYGELTPAGSALAEEIQQALSREIEQVVQYLQQRTGARLEGRLQQLQQAVPDLGQALQAMDEIIARRGLIELRPRLDLILERLERPEFEIAVFGRVSSGKSSLLNAIAGQDLLPVGATPITAVPTRLTWSEHPTVLVEFAEVPPRHIPVQELAEFATEEGNPGNRRHVCRIEVRAPSSRLHAGVALVDTPGIGSLARHGTQEALAYLPRCDLAVLLVDASSALNAEDMDLLRLLLEAGTPVQILISKADLLNEREVDRMYVYVRTQVRELLQTDLPVFPVSVQVSDDFLLWRWFEQEIQPLCERRQELTLASLRRKAGGLREALSGLLAARLRTNPLSGEVQERLRLLLRRGDRILHEAETFVFAQRPRRQESDQAVFQRVAGAILSQSLSPQSRQHLLRDEVLNACDQASQSAMHSLDAVRGQLQDILRELRDLAPAISSGAGSVTTSRSAGLPIPHWEPPTDVSIPNSPWWSAVSASGAKIWLIHQLHERWGALVHEALSSQTRLLQLWMRDEIRKLKAMYESEVDVARERLLLADDDALTGSPACDPQLQEDLAMLDQLGARHSPTLRRGDPHAAEEPYATRTFPASTALVTKEPV